MPTDSFGNWVAGNPNPGPMNPPYIPPSVPDAIAVPGPPTAVPPAIQNVVVDSNGRLWVYYAGGWN